MSDLIEKSIIESDLENANQMKEPKIEEALKRINEVSSRKLTELDLKNLNLSELPKQIYQLSFLEILILRDNPLEEIDEEIGNLKALKRIELSGVVFSTLPDSFGSLINLKFIHLSGANINSFPLQLISLLHLEYLNLTDCNIPELPQEMDSFENLKTLWLLRNPVCDINHLSKLLSRIQQLSLCQTSITKYDFLKRLNNIENLSLGNSNLTTF
jgi:Leucine-rich repeat (LRR) protein